MSRSILSRLEKLERVLEPLKGPRHIMLVAADDPEAQELIAQQEEWRPGELPPGIVVLIGVHRSPGAVVS